MYLKYGPDDRVPVKQSIAYAGQHIIFFIASAVVMPIMVGYAMGLSQEDVGALLQRTLVLCGVMSALQTCFGHRYPIMDGPAGLWSGLLILMASSMTTFGKDLSVLRTDLETGMMVAGALIMLLVVIGLMGPMLRLFTPVINGVLMVMMSLQISPSIVKGMTGITAENHLIVGKSVIVFLFTMFLILFINMYAKGFFRSIATFIGVIAGWILSALLGLTTSVDYFHKGVITLPEAFAFGRPTLDWGIILTCIIAALVLLSMTFASIHGMAEVVEEEVGPKKMKRTVALHGLSTFMAGVFPTVAFMPYIASIGVIKMTGVAARKPFLWASFALIVMGLVAPIGAFFSTIPGSVGYAALVVVFAMIMGQGFKEFQKVKFTDREYFIVGISMLIGVGVMFLPPEAFGALPEAAGHLLSNGLVDGMIIAFLMEHVVFRKKV